MIIKFLKLVLHNFKSHRDLTVEFGDTTQISGDNAKGKSSILEALSWVLYNADTLGSKLDPTPTNYDYDYVRADLLVSVDDKQLLLGRALEKGKAAYYINEVPSKATEFDELIKSLFDKDLFLSLFNPSYFFTLKWTEQRELMMRYVTAPANKEVFKALPAAQADKLGELVKKHSLDDLEKIHRSNKTKLEKEHIAAQSRTRTLQEQLAPLSQFEIDFNKEDQVQNELQKKIDEIEEATKSADENNRRINELNSRIRSMVEQRDRMKEQYKRLSNEEIQENCRVCKQRLDEAAIEATKADKEKRISDFKTEFDQLILQRKALEEELAALEYIDVTEQMEKIKELYRIYDESLELTNQHERRELLQAQVNQAKSDEESKLSSLKESIFIIDSIKDFRAKEAELQAEKVQALFTTLSIRLFKQNKGDGEYKPDFEIEMDGKAYSKLSLSESIRAGLELRDVLSEQSGIVAPCFIDNAESITRFKEPNGQLIVSRVVAGQELLIETEETKSE